MNTIQIKLENLSSWRKKELISFLQKERIEFETVEVLWNKENVMWKMQQIRTRTIWHNLRKSKMS